MMRLIEERDVEDRLILGLPGMGWDHLPTRDVLGLRSGNLTPPFLPQVVQRKLLELTPTW